MDLEANQEGLTMDIALAEAEESTIRDLLWESTLIKTVKNNPQLYDAKHTGYKAAQKSNAAWLTVAEQMGMGNRWKVCKDKWQVLRTSYERKRTNFLVGKERGKWPRWKFFDQMNFLHSYISHRPEQTYQGVSIQWEDSDSDDESLPLPRTREIENNVIFEDDVSVKSEEEDEEEEDELEEVEPEEIERVIKRPRFSNNISMTEENNIRNSALEDLDAELLREKDPLSLPIEEKPIKEEVEWAHEEMDEEDQSLIKEEESTTITLQQPPATLANENRPMVLQVQLPGGKSLPAFIPNRKQDMINGKVEMVIPKPMNAVPIKIKTVSSSQLRNSNLTIPVLSSSPVPNILPNVPIMKENLNCPKPPTPTVSSPSRDPLQDTTEGNPSEEEVLEDEEELFGRYVGAAIKKLSRKSQSRAKMLIQRILYKCEEADRDSGVNGKDSGTASSEG